MSDLMYAAWPTALALSVAGYLVFRLIRLVEEGGDTFAAQTPGGFGTCALKEPEAAAASDAQWNRASWTASGNGTADLFDLGRNTAGP